MPKNKKYTQEQLREAVGIAERYEPGAGAEPKRKTHLQEAGRRLRMRKRRKADRKKLKQMDASERESYRTRHLKRQAKERYGTDI